MVWPVVVALLAEQLLPTAEVLSLNPVNIFNMHLVLIVEKTILTEQRLGIAN